MQWTSHCVPWQIDFVGVLFGLWPRFLLFLVLCCLLRCFRRRNASLAGGFAGRRVWLVSVVFVCCINRFACSNGHGMSLYKRLSYSLCSCKDRAFSATSATHEEKKALCRAKITEGERVVPPVVALHGRFLCTNLGRRSISKGNMATPQLKPCRG